jgi:ferredoxin
MNLQSSPRQRALAALASLAAAAPVPAVEMAVGNRLVIIGALEVALGWAERLAATMQVTVVATAPGVALSAYQAAYPEIAFLAASSLSVSGHAGNFSLAIEHGGKQEVVHADLVFDLRPAPHWSGFALPFGYQAPGSDPLDQALAALALVQAPGEWQKPRYVRFDASQCAHSRNQIVGCTRCLSACDTQAIRPQGDHVVVDPYWCQGCAGCVGVCPTGALRFQYPRPEDWATAVAAVVAAWPADQGLTLLCYDERWHKARSLAEGQGWEWPEEVLPLPIWRTALFNEELFLFALLKGVARLVLVVPEEESALPALLCSKAVVEAILLALGDDAAGQRIVVTHAATPAEAVADLAPAPLPLVVPGRFPFLLQPEKRDSLRLIHRALKELAEERGVTQPVPLPSGATWGRVAVAESCTLCFSCVAACPTQALRAGQEEPALLFVENRCVQCGLCEQTCPEQAITRQAQWNPLPSAESPQLLRRSEPFFCPECGTLMGPQILIEQMVATLRGHPLFATPEHEMLLRLCADCRVKAQFRESNPVRIWEVL